MNKLAALILAVLALLVPQVASAHPLGNFTINRYSRIEIVGSQVRIRYVLDMAEIPTFQERPIIDAGYSARKAAELASRVHLSVDGRPEAVSVSQPELSFLEGQGGL